MGTMAGMKSSITCSITTGQQILKSTSDIVSSNFRIYQTVIKIYDFILTMPRQVEREQPIYFEDAYGKHAPFYLEWVYSADVLQDWLKRRFEGVGSQKIEDGEYILEDSKTQRQLDLTQNWHSLFRPGMHVVMDMVFERRICKSKDESACPVCGEECEESFNKRVNWYVMTPLGRATDSLMGSVLCVVLSFSPCYLMMHPRYIWILVSVHESRRKDHIQALFIMTRTKILYTDSPYPSKMICGATKGFVFQFL
jgi:hypothetical protein